MFDLKRPDEEMEQNLRLFFTLEIFPELDQEYFIFTSRTGFLGSKAFQVIL